MNKRQFLDLLQNGHAQIVQLETQAAKAGVALEKGALGYWSIKEVIAHLIGSHRHLISELEVIARDGKLTPIDTGMMAQGDEDWETALNRFNAQAVALYADRSFDEVRVDFDQTFGRILELSQGFSEEQLLSPFEAGSNELLWESISSNTYGHYEEHLSQLRAWLGQHVSK